MTTFSSGRERTTALGVWGGVGGAGAAVGVLLGGVLSELVGWRAIFFQPSRSSPMTKGAHLGQHRRGSNLARREWLNPRHSTTMETPIR